MPSTWNPGKSSTANGTAERACTFCRLCRLREGMVNKHAGLVETRSQVARDRLDGNLSSCDCNCFDICSTTRWIRSLGAH